MEVVQCSVPERPHALVAADVDIPEIDYEARGDVTAVEQCQWAIMDVMEARRESEGGAAPELPGESEGIVECHLIAACGLREQRCVLVGCFGLKALFVDALSHDSDAPLGECRFRCGRVGNHTRS